MSTANPSAPTEAEPVIMEVEERIIVPNGDCWVTARKLVNDSSKLPSKSEVYIDRKFKVSRKILEDKSEFFKLTFRKEFSNFKDATKPILEEVKRDILEVILEVLHNTVSAESLKRPIKDLWLIISLCDRYQIGHKVLTGWFIGWFRKNLGTPDNGRKVRAREDVYRAQRVHGTFPMAQDHSPRKALRALLFPCYAFGHANAFMEVTRLLVYGSKGHIYESNPSTEIHIRTPVRIVQQLNGARGRVRTLPEKAVYAPVTAAVDSSPSPCSSRVIHGFLRELRRLELFPSIETMAAKTPLVEIMETLKKFSYEPDHHNRGCGWCRTNYDGVVHEAAERYEKHFDGLCLDCIAKPKEQENPLGSEEWQRLKERDEWSQGCRIRHGEPTWYFSYHAREEIRRFGP